MKRKLLSTLLLATVLLAGEGKGTAQTKVDNSNSSSKFNSFFDLYKDNRDKKIPNYISLDFILTANYLFKQQSVTEIEEKYLYPKIKTLAKNLQNTITTNYSKDKREALAYTLVLNELIGNKIKNIDKLDKEALELAKRELELIKAHKDIAKSPIAKVKLDYSQYVVRGKYKDKESLKSYFLALKYMTYTPFVVNHHKAIEITKEDADRALKSAVVLSKAIKESSLKEYQEIEATLRKFSGKGDDLSILNIVYPPRDIKDLREYLNGLNIYPKINETIIDTKSIKKEDIAKVTLTVKLLPSRFTPDSYIFSQLVYPYVGELEKGHKPDRLTSTIDGKQVRGYPTIGDIGAVVADKYPKEIYYKGYKEQVNKLKVDIKDIDEKSIYGYDFKIYNRLLNSNRDNSFKGYYTQSRYILNLYQKQSYTGGTKSISIDQRERACLEKNISDILELLIAEDKLLFNQKSDISMVKELQRLKEIDKKDGNLTEDDIDYLNNLDKIFNAILDNRDKPIEVDIHTNPIEKKAMYEILLSPNVKEINGCRGAFYSHKEEIKSRK
jgi:hypothetical protein